MFNIVQKKSIFAIISILIVVAGIACYFINGGFNLDIDFAGGTEINVPNIKYDEKAIIKAFEKIENVDVSSVQKVAETNGVLIKTKADLDAKQTKEVKTVLKDTFKIKEDISVQSISATVGKELWKSAITSILVAAVLMLLYITFRFEVLSGIAAVIALIHDLAIMISFYIIFRVPVNTSFIAALLTILGYSINATIVIFDRIRENARLSKKTSFADVVNTSIWQTLGRSINTSLTTLFTLDRKSVV